MSKGNLFIISGPSGTGKGTIVSKLLESMGSLWLSVSATTRQPRPGEHDGIDYFFLTPQEFDHLESTDGLLEFSHHFSHSYGTPRKPVLDHIEQGISVLLEIDVAGALQVAKKVPGAVTIFIKPPSIEELRRRLLERGSETAEQIDERINRVDEEMKQATRYNYVVVNDDLSRAVSEVEDIITQNIATKE